MKSESARELFKQYSGALAYVAVRDLHGDEGIGTAFHVGEGVFVTARHVLENNSIVEIATTTRAEIIINTSTIDDAKSQRVEPLIYHVEPRTLKVVEGPFFAADPSIDVAVFRVEGLDPRTPRVPLGLHFDDTIGDDDFVLSEAIVLGYPPIPNTNVPRQVAVRAEVNAVIDVRHAKHVHFVISAMARGGFSGGLVLSEYGHALGVVTESLIRDEAPPEVGFMSVLSVEAIYSCLAEFFTLEISEFWAYSDSSTLILIKMTKPDLARLNPRLFNTTISIYDDDRDVFVELKSYDSEALADAYSAFNSVTPVVIVESQSRPGYLFLLPTENPPATILKEAARAAQDSFHLNGFATS